MSKLVKQLATLSLIIYSYAPGLAQSLVVNIVPCDEQSSKVTMCVLADVRNGPDEIAQSYLPQVCKHVDTFLKGRLKSSADLRLALKHKTLVVSLNSRGRVLYQIVPVAKRNRKTPTDNGVIVSKLDSNDWRFSRVAASSAGLPAPAVQAPTSTAPSSVIGSEASARLGQNAIDLMKQKRFQEAYEMAERAVAAEDNVKSRSARGICAMAHGLYTTGIQDFLKALEYEPSNGTVRCLAVAALKSVGKLEEARSISATIEGNDEAEKEVIMNMMAIKRAESLRDQGYK